MKYIFGLMACLLLFAQCNPSVNVQPAGSFDTLGIHWMTIERNHISYYFQGTGIKGASIYTDMYEGAYEKLDPLFNAKLPQKLRFFVWTDLVAAEQILGLPLSFAVGSQCVCHVKMNQSTGHEMTHILSYWSGGTPRETYSRLVSEGVAVAFDLGGDDKMLAAKSVLATQSIHSITDLWSGSYQMAPEEIFYPIAGAFMDFLYKKQMPGQFNALIKRQTQEDAEDIYGKEQLSALIAEFNTLAGIKG